MTEEGKSLGERRKHPRFALHVYCRIEKSQSLRQRVSNISLGGVRIYSDQRLDVNEKVELELHFPSGFSSKGLARVVWIKELPPNSGASYDVGFEFLNLPEEAVDELKKALENKS